MGNTNVCHFRYPASSPREGMRQVPGNRQMKFW
jgi:hypothetical protein